MPRISDAPVTHVRWTGLTRHRYNHTRGGVGRVAPRIATAAPSAAGIRPKRHGQHCPIVCGCAPPTSSARGGRPVPTELLGLAQ